MFRRKEDWNCKGLPKGISKESPFTDFRDYTEVILDIASKHKLGILLMLDEFDKLQKALTTRRPPHKF